jgi:four helix bundle protein
MRKINKYQRNILEQTKRFAIEMVKLFSGLSKNLAGFTIADQLVRAGTSIGANLIEAQEAVSLKDFFYKITISLKETK